MIFLISDTLCFYLILFNCLVTISLLTCSLLTLIIHFSENIIHSIISLLIISMFMGLIFLLAGLEYFSLIYMMIYLGSIIVIFLFVLMSSDLRREDTIFNKHWIHTYIYAFTLIFSILIFMVTLLYPLITDNNNFTLFDIVCIPTKNTFNYYEFYLNDILIFNKIFYNYFSEYVTMMVSLLFFTLVISIGVCMHSEDRLAHIIVYNEEEKFFLLKNKKQ